MIKKRTAWIIGISSFLIPVIIFVLLFNFVMSQVTMMGTSQRLTKTNNYTSLTDIAPHEATVFFGDSITELCPTEEIYADYMKTSGISVINRGISAETTTTMVERFEDNVIGLKPRNLVLLMGVNDLSEGTSLEQIVKNIQTMIQMTKTKSPQTHIILQAVYPINKTEREEYYEKFQIGDRDNETINQLNKKLEKLASDEQITFLNVNEYLMNEQGELRNDYTSDGLHPNIAGYMAIRDQIIKKLK